MFDERGLYLLVRKSGSKLWRLKYRLAGKEKTLAIGPYPEVSLAQARHARDKAQLQLRDGIDPSAEKQSRKAQAAADALDSFEKVARALCAATSGELATHMYGSDTDARREHEEMLGLSFAPSASANLALYPGSRSSKQKGQRTLRRPLSSDLCCPPCRNTSSRLQRSASGAAV